MNFNNPFKNFGRKEAVKVTTDTAKVVAAAAFLSGVVNTTKLEAGQSNDKNLEAKEITMNTASPEISTDTYVMVAEDFSAADSLETLQEMLADAQEVLESKRDTAEAIKAKFMGAHAEAESHIKGNKKIFSETDDLPELIKNYVKKQVIDRSPNLDLTNEAHVAKTIEKITRDVMSEPTIQNHDVIIQAEVNRQAVGEITVHKNIDALKGTTEDFSVRDFLQGFGREYVEAIGKQLTAEKKVKEIEAKITKLQIEHGANLAASQ